MQALLDALDAARRARSLTWVALTAEINKPFHGTPSIPISIGTIRSMRTKRAVTSAVVLQVLRWLGRTPESFLRGNEASADVPDMNQALPEPGPSRILRFDTAAMYRAINDERIRRGMTWKQLARELPGFTENMLKNLANGPLIGFPHVTMIPQWLGCPAATFVRIDRR
jgi:hypothetical protein